MYVCYSHETQEDWKPSPHYTVISVILFFNHVFPSLGEVRVILHHGINKNILFFFFKLNSVAPTQLFPTVLTVFESSVVPEGF